MTTPFPGMNPFLEGYLWPDLHGSLAHQIKEMLAPLISPKYVARTDVYTVNDTAPDEDIGIMYPDVEILQRNQRYKKEPSIQEGNIAVATPVTTIIPTITSLEVRIPIVEIRDRAKNQLITAIEILSPVNKRKPGLEPYRKKRLNLHQTGVHLLELDLLRRGTRPLNHPLLPKTHYIITLLRADTWKTEVWGINIEDKLPNLPVPLKHPDNDVVFDLGVALRTVYEKNLYHLSIDYKESSPPPSFNKEEKLWMEDLLRKNKMI